MSSHIELHEDLNNLTESLTDLWQILSVNSKPENSTQLYRNILALDESIQKKVDKMMILQQKTRRIKELRAMVEKNRRDMNVMVGHAIALDQSIQNTMSSGFIARNYTRLSHVQQFYDHANELIRQTIQTTENTQLTHSMEDSHTSSTRAVDSTKLLHNPVSASYLTTPDPYSKLVTICPCHQNCDLDNCKCECMCVAGPASTPLAKTELLGVWRPNQIQFRSDNLAPYIPNYNSGSESEQSQTQPHIFTDHLQITGRKAPFAQPSDGSVVLPSVSAEGLLHSAEKTANNTQLPTSALHSLWVTPFNITNIHQQKFALSSLPLDQLLQQARRLNTSPSPVQ